MNYEIYGLVDPRDDRVRYIGRTTNPKARYDAHWSGTTVDAKGPRQAWLSELRAAGTRFNVRVLATATTLRRAQALEGEWIVRGFAEGWPLTNRKKSGGGGLTKKQREQRRARDVAKRYSELGQEIDARIDWRGVAEVGRDFRYMSMWSAETRAKFVAYLVEMGLKSYRRKRKREARAA